jgi:indolepyruvate ferredoxin oxidoreductase alpha subunit
VMQERTHAFAMKSQIWLLDPRPDLPTIVRLVEEGFELSEASHTPVMLMLRIRACHMHGTFIARDNRRPPFTAREALAAPRRSYDRIILPPSTYAQEREKIERRWPAAVRFVRDRQLNELHDGPGEVGLVLQGGLASTVLRALERLGLADVFGSTRVPHYILNVTYPLVAEEVERFAAGKRAILVLEEGQPEFIEQAISRILIKSGSATLVVGKGPLPDAGEYTGEVVLAGLRRFFEAEAPHLLAPPVTLRPRAQLPIEVPARPSGLCTGCPERPLFAAMKLIERELGPLHVSADIGCHSFATLPPFDLGASIMGYGLGAAGAAALGADGPRRPIGLMGDGGFWHNGLTSGVSNAVFNRQDSVTVIVDNGYAAATGGQYVPSSRAAGGDREAGHPIEAAVRGVGVQWVRRTRTYDMRQTLAALRDSLTTPFRGPKVVIAEGECQLNRERREGPERRRREAAGARVLHARFGVDEDVCTGDHSCIRLSGCPSLTLRDSPDPLRREPVAHVDSSCVGCGVCGEVAHAATLCPSFHRVDIIANPGWADRILARLRARIIGWLRGDPTRNGT